MVLFKKICCLKPLKVLIEMSLFMMLTNLFQHVVEYDLKELKAC